MATTLREKMAQLPPERRARVEAEADRLHAEYLTLRDLRKAKALTQEQVAEALGIRQATVAQLEKRSDLLLSTLRGYVEAMGGRLRTLGGVPRPAARGTRMPWRHRGANSPEEGRVAVASDCRIRRSTASGIVARPPWRYGAGGTVRGNPMLPVLTVAGVLLVTAQMHRFGGGVIAGELHRVFDLGAGEIGLIMGAMPLASAVVQVPVGLAFDRFGTRLTVSFLSLVALLGTLILALAEGAAGLAVGRFLIGAGLAAVVTALLLLTMRWAPPERYASVAATVMAAASMAGGLLATVPLGFFLQRAGWTPTFLGIALITLAVIALCFMVLRDAPPGSEARGTRPESVGESLRGLWAVLADPDVRRIMAMATCVIAPFMCVGGLWAGPYLQVVHGLDPAQASWVLLAMITTANVGTFVYGPLDRRLGGRRKVVLGGAVATMAMLGALALWPGPSLWLAIAMLLPARGGHAVLRHADRAQPQLRAGRAGRPRAHHDQPVRARQRVRRAVADRAAGGAARWRRWPRHRDGLSPGVRLPRADAAGRDPGLPGSARAAGGD